MNISIKRFGIVLFWLVTFFFSALYITPLLLPFLFGWLIAYMIQPIVDSIVQWGKLPRPLAIVLALLVFSTLLVWLSVLLFLFISKELLSFSQVFPHYITQFLQFVQNLLPFEIVQKYYLQFQLWYGDGQMKDWLKAISDQGVNVLQSVFATIFRIIGAIPNAVTLIFLSLLSSFFISKDFEQINHWLRSMIPKKVDNVLTRVLADLKSALIGFTKAHFFLTGITSIIAFVGLFILQVDNALMIGLIAGAIDLIPYVGTGILFIPWIIYLYFNQEFDLVISLAILYGLIIIVRQLLEPRILAKTIGLHPLFALVSLFVGLKLFGMLGMILGPFIVILLQALHRAHVYRDVWGYINAQKK